MLSNGQQAAAFIKVLRPALDAANLTNVGIVCCESTGWSQAQSIYSGIKSSGADSMLAVVSSHEYTSRASGSLSTTHHSWSSEYADLNGGWTISWYGGGGAGEGMTWANTIYTAIVNANVSGYIAWEGVSEHWAFQFWLLSPTKFPLMHFNTSCIWLKAGNISKEAITDSPLFRYKVVPQMRSSFKSTRRGMITRRPNVFGHLDSTLEQFSQVL
jgi:hypothetical protein